MDKKFKVEDFDIATRDATLKSQAYDFIDGQDTYYTAVHFQLA